VEVLGLQGVPQAGDNFQVVADISRGAANFANIGRCSVDNQRSCNQPSAGIEALGQSEVKELLVIIKADVSGLGGSAQVDTPEALDGPGESEGHPLRRRRHH